MAVAILHYHDMLELSPGAPIRGDLLRREERVEAKTSPAAASYNSDDVIFKQNELIDRQTKLIESLAAQVGTLNSRIRALEDPHEAKAAASTARAGREIPSSNGELTPARRAGVRSLSSVWYEWFTDRMAMTRQERMVTQRRES